MFERIKQFIEKYAKIFSLFLRKYLILISAIIIISSILITYKFHKILVSLPNLDKLTNYEPSIPTVIYSQDGVKIAEIFEERRYPVFINEMSPFLKNAFIAAEDADFYNHHGLDLKGFLRALFHFATFSNQKQGGSTITQQLAKNVLLSKERTIVRKVKDIIVARQIEEAFTKDKILELYLNTIYLGNGSYGVEAASENYFRKSNIKLTLAESAIIAGLAPAPSTYDPTENLAVAKQRQLYVLERMFKNDMITNRQYEAAIKEELAFYKAESPNNKIAPHFVAEVKKQLEKQLEVNNIGTSGLSVYTTLNTKIQNAAKNAVQTFSEQYQYRKSFKGPIKRHGDKFKDKIKELVKSPLSETEYEKAIVVEIEESLRAVGIVTQKGVGVLLYEDMMWAINSVRVDKKNDKNNEKNIDKKDIEPEEPDINKILKIGDEIHIKKVNKNMHQRIVKDKKFLTTMTAFSKYFENPDKDKLQRYTLTDSLGIEAAALVMDSHTGEVLAMVGGDQFLQSQFNRATQAERQVGSSVKPLYYSYAIDSGFSPASKIDSPTIDLDGWQPGNYGGKESGRTTLLQSLAQSFNIPSVFLYQLLGTTKVTKHLSRYGFNWPYSDLSMALGAGTSTLLKMVQSYTVFPNQGKLSLAYYIQEIVDRNGNVIFSAKNNKIYAFNVNPPFPEDAPYLPGKTELTNETDTTLQMISPQSAYVTLQMLRSTVLYGTGQGAQGLSLYVGGKTGTTNGNTDAWFLGVASQLVGGVWVGYDDNSKTLGGGGTGSGMAVPIWRSMMQTAIQVYPLQYWVRPKGVHEIRINKDTGDLSTGSDGVSVFVIDGTEPGGVYSRNAFEEKENGLDNHLELSISPEKKESTSIVSPHSG
jgi:penicillin-binding protein 1A